MHNSLSASKLPIKWHFVRVLKTCLCRMFSAGKFNWRSGMHLSNAELLHHSFGKQNMHGHACFLAGLFTRCACEFDFPKQLLWGTVQRTTYRRGCKRGGGGV